MRVKRTARGKGHGKSCGNSYKWKDTRTKRCRPTAPVTSSDLNSSPAISVHHALSKRKPIVNSAAAAMEEVEDLLQDSISGFPHHGNGLEIIHDELFYEPGRLEEMALHTCAIRDDKKNHAVVVMQKDQNLCFRGKCFLTCLYGRVEVMGFTIEEGQQPYPLFSPASHCPLTVRAMETENTHTGEPAQLLDILKDYLPSRSRKNLIRRVIKNSSIVLLEPLESTMTKFLSSFPAFSEVFSPPASELFSAVLDTPLNGLGIVPLLRDIDGLMSSESLTDALSTLVDACKANMEGTIILVCGGKNVGKSTFIRVLINTLLNHTGGVEYLEGDLGQTEFTPSGCLSLTTVREPLLGPPFTHQRLTDHMVYYGQTSCEFEPERYLDTLKFIWNRRPQSMDSPLIINTMGWVKGFGFKLLVDLIRFFPVTHVVQLNHGETPQCAALTPQFLRTADGFQTHPCVSTALSEFTESSARLQTYVHLPVQSEFTGVGTQGSVKYQQPNVLRELSLLAYLSQLQSPDPGPVRPLHSLTPFQVPHSAVAVGTLHHQVVPSDMIYAINGSLVALCCLRERVASRGGPLLLTKAPLCSCVGFGIVRGIDMVRGLYYVLTPVDPTVLREVNCFLMGAIVLPSCITTAQDFEDVPYITSDYNFNLTGAGKLRVFKGRLRQGQNRT